jgi:predicted nucleotide-binding protein (sugar kinase/HSP70/actin superfamily)
MKVTFPRMGYLDIPLRSILQDLGLTVVTPPPCTARTVALGTRHSPEFACYPFKLNIGNYLEAFAQGADTILMAGGSGPCRFGYYAQVQREILTDLGYQFEMLVLEPPRGQIDVLLRQLAKLTGHPDLRTVWRAFRLGWEKINALDALERKAMATRAYEMQRGAVTRLLAKAVKEVDAAASVLETRLARRRGEEAMAAMAKKRRQALRIGIVGEIYTVLEPFANMRVAERLGEMGVEVERALFLGDWIRTNLFLDALGLRRERPQVRAARPFVNHFVGGEGRESVGNTVLYSKRGFDGVLQLGPLTCMPEIVAEGILPRVSRELGIPCMTLMFDEHAGEAGILTRLEAFVELMERRRRAKGERSEGGKMLSGN